ncbi:MAG: manganese efflux pump [Clostridia bacterium]|nr:manganese efflux pump [Clostridia bacterium]
MWSFSFFFNSILTGGGLAMDAFSVSLANGLHEPNMRRRRMFAIAGVFAGFQFLMPMIGWLCVHTLAEIFSSFQKFIPWIALGLLCFIGGKMIYDSRREEEEAECKVCGITALLMQGIATSIDALSVGFTISAYGALQALVSCLIIALVTFCICTGGLLIGRRFGTALAGKASVLGGCILIFIGIEIFLTGIL